MMMEIGHIVEVIYYKKYVEKGYDVTQFGEIVRIDMIDSTHPLVYVKSRSGKTWKHVPGELRRAQEFGEMDSALML